MTPARGAPDLRQVKGVVQLESPDMRLIRFSSPVLIGLCDSRWRSVLKHSPAPARTTNRQSFSAG